MAPINISLYSILFACCLTPLEAISIEEKALEIQNLENVIEINQNDLQEDLFKKKQELSLYHKELEQYLENHTPIPNTLEEKIHLLQAQTQDIYSQWIQNTHNFSLNQQVLIQGEDISLYDFILNFTGNQKIYLIPESIKNIRLNISSEISIPKAYWEDFIKLTLKEHNIDLIPVSDHIRKLEKSSRTILSNFYILDSSEELAKLPKDMKAGFYFPLAFDIRHIFLENLETLNLGTNKKLLLEKGAIVFGYVQELQHLNQLLSLIKQKQDAITCKYVDITPLDKELIQAAESMLHEPSSANTSLNKVLCLPFQEKSNALVLIGEKSKVNQLHEIIENIKEQLCSASHRKLFFYRCKHVNIKEIAPSINEFSKILFQNETKTLVSDSSNTENKAPSSTQFIIDANTNSLISYLDDDKSEAFINLIKRLDVPEIMVNIEVLLFEKVLEKNQQLGLSKLSMGTAAENLQSKSFAYEHSESGGVLDFILNTQKTSDTPAVNLAYKFIMSQKNLQINACPSIVTANKKQAEIAIVDEISINTGYTHKNKLYKTFDRKEVGIRICVTPQVQYPSSPEQKALINLTTDIHFDTAKTTGELPEISKRTLKNEIRVKDGESIILGGLRRKIKDNTKGFMPFIGEISGLEKFFGYDHGKDEQTEIFICLTPSIIQKDKQEKLFNDPSKPFLRPGESPLLNDIINQTPNTL